MRITPGRNAENSWQSTGVHPASDSEPKCAATAVESGSPWRRCRSSSGGGAAGSGPTVSSPAVPLTCHRGRRTVSPRHSPPVAVVRLERGDAEAAGSRTRLQCGDGSCSPQRRAAGRRGWRPQWRPALRPGRMRAGGSHGQRSRRRTRRKYGRSLWVRQDFRQRKRRQGTRGNAAGGVRDRGSCCALTPGDLDDLAHEHPERPDEVRPTSDNATPCCPFDGASLDS